jgi:hypothetical protein
VRFTVTRIFDAEGRACAQNKRNLRYYLDPEEETKLGCSIQEGIWRAIITGSVRDKVHLYEEVWREMVPYLLEMSKMTEMVKMENLFWQAAPGHEELHTDTGDYAEGLSAIIAKEEKLLGEVAVGKPLRGLLHMPSPKVVRKEYPPEHYELHTDTGSYDE